MEMLLSMPPHERNSCTILVEVSSIVTLSPSTNVRSNVFSLRVCISKTFVLYRFLLISFFFFFGKSVIKVGANNRL